MKDKLEVGMYVRYTRGAINGYVPSKIGKILERLNDSEFIKLDTNCTILENDIIGEPSFNPINIIKHKDIILGKDGKLYQCWKVYKDYVFTYSKNKQGLTITLVDYQIDRVMCYEQFESISYKL